MRRTFLIPFLRQVKQLLQPTIPQEPSEDYRKSQILIVASVLIFLVVFLFLISNVYLILSTLDDTQSIDQFYFTLDLLASVSAFFIIRLSRTYRYEVACVALISLLSIYLIVITVAPNIETNSQTDLVLIMFTMTYNIILANLILSFDKYIVISSFNIVLSLLLTIFVLETDYLASLMVVILYFSFVFGLLELNRHYRSIIETQNANLIKLNHDLEGFAYNVAHDLQGPLKTAHKFVELVKGSYDGNLGVEEEKWLGFLTQSMTRMNLTVEGLLKLASLQAIDDDFKLIDLNEIINHIIEFDLKFELEKSHGKIQIDQNLHNVMGISILIGQLFQNLISNALKFVQDDVYPVVIISSTENDKFIQISVNDNGIGIAYEIKDKIFDMFYRKDKSNQSGAGIGLALCKNIMQIHNGDIILQSGHQGSSFMITFPKINGYAKY